MAIKTRKIKLGIVVGWDPSRPDPRGVRVTEKNFIEVKYWIGGKTEAIQLQKPNSEVIDHKVKIFTDRGNRVRVARVGDVVYKIDKERFGVIKAKDFLGFEK